MAFQILVALCSKSTLYTPWWTISRIFSVKQETFMSNLCWLFFPVSYFPQSVFLEKHNFVSNAYGQENVNYKSLISVGCAELTNFNNFLYTFHLFYLLFHNLFVFQLKHKFALLKANHIFSHSSHHTH